MTTALPQIVTLVCNCESHPAQWTGESADGRTLHMQYNHGEVYASLGPPTLDEVEWQKTGWKHEETVGMHGDCEMPTEEMMKRTAHLLDWTRTTVGA